MVKKEIKMDKRTNETQPNKTRTPQTKAKSSRYKRSSYKPVRKRFYPTFLTCFTSLKLFISRWQK